MLVVAKHAAENSKVFCMNLSAPFLIQFFGDQMATMMPYCDFLFGNESEAAVYGEAKGYGTDIPTIALKIAGQPKASGILVTAIEYCVVKIGTATAAVDSNHLTALCCRHETSCGGHHPRLVGDHRGGPRGGSYLPCREDSQPSTG